MPLAIGIPCQVYYINTPDVESLSTERCHNLGMCKTQRNTTSPTKTPPQRTPIETPKWGHLGIKPTSIRSQRQHRIYSEVYVGEDNVY